MRVKTVVSIPTTIVEQIMFLFGFSRPHLLYFYQPDINNDYGYTYMSESTVDNYGATGIFALNYYFQSESLYMWD